jgi:threonine dehydrogenase-like Zn-dependent dehydrogenase
MADATLVPIPEGTPLEHALFAADVLPTGFFGAELAGVGRGATVVVVGCGPVGLCAVLGSLDRGASCVVAVDPVPYRRQLAGSFGATPVHPDGARDLLFALTENRGADAAIEVVGSPAASRLAFDLVRPGGAIGAVGVHTEPAFAFTPGDLYDRNLTYRAGRCPARRGMEHLLSRLPLWQEPLAALVTHRLPLSAGPDAYRMFDEKREDCVKVLLEPDAL